MADTKAELTRRPLDPSVLDWLIDLPPDMATGRVARPPALAVVLQDLLILVAAYTLAFLTRFVDTGCAEMIHGAVRWAPALIAAQLSGLFVARLYGGSRLALIGGLTVGTAAGHLLSFAFIQNLAVVSRAAMALDFLLALPAAWIAQPPPATRHSEGDLIDAASAGEGISGSLGALIQYRELIRNLVSKDLKLKYRGSFFGFLWSLFNPLVTILVYLVAFKYIMAVRGGGFIMLLLLGILAWTFFANSAGMGAGAIVDNGGLLKTVHFPRAVLPISAVLFNLAQYLLTISVFLPVMLLVYRLAPHPAMLLFPIVVLLQLAMTIGIALALSAGVAFFRDIRHFLEIALMMMFWTTPIVYDYEKVPEAWRWLVLLSPMSPFVLSYQQIFYYGRVPDPEVCLVALLYASIGFFGGFAIFTRFQHEFVEQI